MKSALLFLGVCLLSACAEPPPPATPFKVVLDTKRFMSHVLDPAADVIWGSTGFITTMDGEEDLSPTTDEGWLVVEQNAAIIIESGNLLMLPGRAKDQGDWVEISSGLIQVGEHAMAAAEAQDAEALFKAGGDLYNVCTSCHQLYIFEAAEEAN